MALYGIYESILACPFAIASFEGTGGSHWANISTESPLDPTVVFAISFAATDTNRGGCT